jgi:hypothetical protein
LQLTAEFTSYFHVDYTVACGIALGPPPPAMFECYNDKGHFQFCAGSPIVISTDTEGTRRTAAP